MFKVMETTVAIVDNQDKPIMVAEEAHRIVRLAAEPWAPGDCVKAGINRASRVLDITFRRAKTLWYRQPCALLAVEMDHLRTKQRFLLAQRLNRLDNERADIAARLSALEETHADVVARIQGAGLGRAGQVGSGPRRALPGEAGDSAHQVAGSAGEGA